MTQLFSNNAETALAETLLIEATSITFTDGSVFQAPSGGDFELLTLQYLSLVEIIRVTSRVGNTATIVRGQEGTTAQEWTAGTKVFSGVTAGTLQQAMVSGVQNETSETGSVALKLGDWGEVAAGTENAFVFGADAYADTAGQIAIGNGVYMEEGISVAIGEYSGVVGGNGVAVGYAAFSRLDGVAVGQYSNIAGGAAGGVAVGSDARVNASAVGGIALGRNASVAIDAIGSIVIGDGAATSYGNVGAVAIGDTLARASHALQIGALYTVPRGLGTGADAAWTMSAGAAVIMSEPLDLKTLLTHTITIPTGLSFFVDEIGVIAVSASGVTVQPTIAFGVTGTPDKFAAAALTTGLAAPNNRHRIVAPDSADGVTTLQAEVTMAASATALTGRVYWRGIAVVNNS